SGAITVVMEYSYHRLLCDQNTTSQILIIRIRMQKNTFILKTLTKKGENVFVLHLENDSLKIFCHRLHQRLGIEHRVLET
ncbi:20529_t:CDS:1, partial [Rhizophagus irregularis]